MSKLEAVNELVFITPSGVIKTPFGLIKVTFPLEFNLPDIVDGVDPLTLFRDDELDDGILKSTLPPE